MLRENLNDFLDKIEWKEVKKEYLTLDEVKQLAATPCRIPVLKQASLFACMTGLRISDILQLKWSDFEMGPDQGYYIRICTEKTETEATLPISHEALELCGEWGRIGVQRTYSRNDSPPVEKVDCRCRDKEENNLPLFESQYFFFLADNKRFTELNFATGNDLETSEVP